MKIPRQIFIALGVIIGIVIVLLVAHEIIEARIFDMLSKQQGVEVKIGGRNGNLLSGYDLRDIVVRQTISRGDTPPCTFRTSKLTVHWMLRPFSITEILWDSGSLTFYPEDAAEEEVSIGAGSMRSDGSGWLATDGDIQVGPGSWDGSMTLKIRIDGQEIDGGINIERLPSKFVRMMGNIPAGFAVPHEAVVEIRLEGSPSNIQANGSVSDPVTRRAYRF